MELAHSLPNIVEHSSLTQMDFQDFSKLPCYNKASRTTFKTLMMVQIIFWWPTVHCPFSEHPSNLLIFTINDLVSLFTF